MKTEIKSSGCAILFLIPFVFVGIFTLYKSLSNIQDSINTYDWLATTALINNVDIESDYDDGSESHEIDINYEYSIDDHVYKSNKIAFGYGMSNVEKHVKIYDLLKRAKKITVYVNPENYNEAVISRGINSSSIFLLIFSIMWNSLLSLFIVPLISLQSSQPSTKRFFIVIGIWIIGFTSFLSGFVQDSLEMKIDVLEKREVIENDYSDE